MDSRAAEAPAKLNLTLRVVGRRADGFHEIESLVARISLCDNVCVTARDDPQVTLTCDHAGVPTDASNLATRAAQALTDRVGVRGGADIALTKRIPMGAGLGGGSSDAATTLLLLNRLWRLGLTRDELAGVGAGLGSDVPLFLHGPQCVLRGRGERIEDVALTRPYWAALILPEIHCATPAVYGAWDGLPHPPARLGLEQVLSVREGAAGLMEMLYNDLEEAAFTVSPALRELANRIATRCGQPVRMSGSGAALFRLFDDAPAAARFALSVGMECAVRGDVVSLRAGA